MSIKKFLVPVAALISTLGVAKASPSPIINLQDDSKSSSVDATNPASVANSDVLGSMFNYAKGDEMHALTVKPNEQGVMVAYHYSHSSHASHSSHSSHYSSR